MAYITFRPRSAHGLLLDGGLSTTSGDLEEGQ